MPNKITAPLDQPQEALQNAARAVAEREHKTDKPDIRMTRPGRVKQLAKLGSVMERHGIGARAPFDFSDDKATYYAMQMDQPCYFDVFIELQDASKATPLIAEVAALGLEVELSYGDAEAITHKVQ